MSVATIFHWRTRYTDMAKKFKAILEDGKKLAKALNEKNSLMIKQIEIIEGLQKKIFDHEKIVSMKVVDNEKLVKAIESLHKNFNTAVKELANTKNIVKALNDQLTVEEKKNKAHEQEKDNLLKERDLAGQETSKLQAQLVGQKSATEKKSVEHVQQLQQAFKIVREDGFKKALYQLALFAHKINLKKFDVLKDVKDGELVRESQMESFEDDSDSETISKARNVEATLLPVLTLNRSTTQFIQVI